MPEREMRGRRKEMRDLEERERGRRREKEKKLIGKAKQRKRGGKREGWCSFQEGLWSVMEACFSPGRRVEPLQR